MEYPQTKPFPWLFVSSILCIIGLLLIASIWYMVTISQTTSHSKPLPTPFPTQSVSLAPSISITQQATSSSQGIFIFPTKQVTLQIPQGWTTSLGTTDTHQLSQWWLPDNSVTIHSSDIQTSFSNCPEGGCIATYDASLSIIDYGANAFTTAQAWYEGKASKDTNSLQATSSATIVTQATINNQSAYCVSPDISQSVAGLPHDIPEDLFTGQCYILWKAHIYSFAAKINQQSSQFSTNRNLLVLLIRSIQLVP